MDIAVAMRFPCFCKWDKRSNLVTGVANSAAAVGVAARRSATKSARVVSVSCPTLEIAASSNQTGPKSMEREGWIERGMDGERDGWRGYSAMMHSQGRNSLNVGSEL